MLESLFNNSETVKAVTLAFCSIRQHFIRDIPAKFGIPNWHQSPDIGQNSDQGIISDFRSSGQSFINENSHNSRTSLNIDMKLGPITKLDKKNTATSKKFDDDFYWKTVTSLSFLRLMAILKPPESGFWTHGLTITFYKS